MNHPIGVRRYSIAVIAIGGLLALVSAFVPHFDAGYRLMFGVLFAGLLPYGIYALTLPYLSDWRLPLLGVTMVALHAWVVIRERVVDYRGYQDGLICLLPVALALGATLVLAWALLHAPPGARR